MYRLKSMIVAWLYSLLILLMVTVMVTVMVTGCSSPVANAAAGNSIRKLASQGQAQGESSEAKTETVQKSPVPPSRPSCCSHASGSRCPCHPGSEHY